METRKLILLPVPAAANPLAYSLFLIRSRNCRIACVEFGGIGCGNLLRAASDGKRLQPLGSHDSAHAVAGRNPASLADNARQQGFGFSRRADAGDLEFRVSQRLQQHVLRFIRILAPESGGVPQFGGAVLDQQIDRFRGNAVEKNAVIAGGFKLGTKGAPGIGFSPGAGERRFCDQHVPAAARSLSPGQAADNKSKDVLGAQCVHARFHSLIQDANAQAVAADELPVNFFGKDFFHDASLGQIDEQHFACITSGNSHQIPLL